MKIIRKGVLPEDIIYTGECKHCGCQLECNYTEVSRRNLGDRYSGEFIEHSVTCPTPRCGRRIILTEKPEPLGKDVNLVFNKGQFEVYESPNPLAG